MKIISNIKFRVLAGSIMAGTEAGSDQRDERGRKTREQYEAERVPYPEIPLHVDASAKKKKQPY